MSDILPGDFLAAEFLFCHEHRPVAVAHARAARQQCVFVADIGVGVDADRRDVKFAAGRAFVQRLDVLQDVLEPVAVRGNQFLRQPVEHECIIGIGRMSQGQCRLRHAKKVKDANALLIPSYIKRDSEKCFRMDWGAQYS